jgi:hypothetical protein
MPMTADNPATAGPRVQIPPPATNLSFVIPSAVEKSLTAQQENGRRVDLPSVAQAGSSGRIRTYDQSVNSRPLYH